MSTLRVLYKDDDLLLIDKPAGLLTEGDASSLESLVQSVYDERARALHRLDRGTSGVLAFSLRRLHHASFVELWEKRRIKKTYWAAVEGAWPASLRNLEGEDLEGRAMQSRVSVLSTHARYTRLELSPLTGRRHQLRIQCANAGHPIVGDTRYGAKAHEGFDDSFALHARSLEFVHPVTKEKLKIVAEVPAEWQALS